MASTAQAQRQVLLPTFDLEAWASNYEGVLLPLRLLHIALHCPSLARQSLILARDEIQKGKNIQLYDRFVSIAHGLGQTDLQAQPDWARKQEDANRRELARLDGELRGYKNNLIRESIRMGQEDLATHHLHTGGPLQSTTTTAPLGLNAAYQQYVKMREYCTTPTHVNSMNLRIILTLILQAVTEEQSGRPVSQYYGTLLTFTARLRNTGVKAEEQAQLTPISYVAAGLGNLGLGQYRRAAENLLLIPFSHYNSTSSTTQGMNFQRSVASPNDVAIYGALCALATFTRDELQEKVLGGEFRPFLEQEPHIRKAIGLYTTAKYHACLDLLSRYLSDWTLDIFLGGSSPHFVTHVDALFAQIRQRSIQAYLSSYAEISLQALALNFPPAGPPETAAAVVASEVLDMIESGVLDARLDVVNGVLVTPKRDIREETHTKARQTADEIERVLLLRLHKVNCVMAGLEITRVKPNQGPGPGNWTSSIWT